MSATAFAGEHEQQGHGPTPFSVPNDDRSNRAKLITQCVSAEAAILASSQGMEFELFTKLEDQAC